MAETDELAINIKHIRWRQESMDSSMDLLLKANKKAIVQSILESFGNSKRRAEVYLAVDGVRTVGDVAQLLQMKSTNVSRDITKCSEEGLVERIPSDNSPGFTWKKKRIDSVLRISKALKDHFGLS